MDLIARDAELATAIRSVRFGSGTVITGEAGVGKTTLAVAVAESAALNAVPVIRVLATAAGRSIPYAALSPLLPTGSGNFHPALVPGLILTSLTALPGSQLPIVLVDDAQLLDDHSAQALLTLVAQRGARALVTLRPGGRPSDAVTALWKDGLLDRIDLTPLDVAGTSRLLRSRLGDEVAAMTTQMLWEHSRGNPLYLHELVRFGLGTERLQRVNGVWWWAGDTDVPPRLAELLQDRLENLSADAKQARDLLALGEPLPYDTLAAVSSDDAIMELDSQGLVTSDSSGGVVRLRFSHPLLRATAAHGLSAARRRALAGKLIGAPAQDVDFLRRAAWQEAAAGRPDVDLLLRAAQALIVIDPAKAVRFAERAIGHDDGAESAVMLADALAELGRPDDARAALARARERARDEPERWRIAVSQASLSLWSLRSPIDAIDVIDQFTADLSAGATDEHRSVTALLTLFSARPAVADAIADAVLAGSPPPTARRRSLLVRVAAATLADRPDRSQQAADELAEVLSQHPQPESARSLSTAIAGTAEIFGNRSAELPRAGGGSGRWPSPYRSMLESAGTAVVDDDALLTGPVWPLLEGVRRHLAGDLPAAEVALREATVQQLQGEGLFRSEATGGLAVVLAESGQLTEARQVLDGNGPDATALIPGLRGWAEAWLLAGAGRADDAGVLAVRTAIESAEVGAVTTAFWYLADAARFGATQLAAEYAETLADRVHSELTSARLAGLRARAKRDATQLVVAAEMHLQLGLFGQAGELAQLGLELAARPGSRVGDEVARRARAVVGASRTALGHSAPPDASAIPEQLTKREAEISRLAAKGLRDKDIADELVLSVRTVESHLATAYRKLGISSRRELVEVLGGSVR